MSTDNATRPGWDRTDPAEWAPVPTADQSAAFDQYTAARMAHPSYNGALAPVDVSARPRRLRLTLRGERVLLAAAVLAALAILVAMPDAPAPAVNQSAAVAALTLATSTGPNGYGASIIPQPTRATCTGAATGYPVCMMTAHGAPVAIGTGTATGSGYSFTFSPVGQS